MSVFKPPALMGALVVAVSAWSHPAISSVSLKAFDAAVHEANSGQLARATATLNCLIMPKRLTVGFGRPDSNGATVKRAIDVWADSLTNSPFVYSNSPIPDLKVVFVSEIKNGSEVQGQVRCQRQVAWGASTSRYRVNGTIYIRDNVDGRPITEDEASAVVEHELGHVLGLEDDQETNCLMGPFVAGSPVDGPAPEELHTLGAFRNAVADALRQIRSFRYASRPWTGRSRRHRSNALARA